MAFGTFRVPNGERLFAELPEIRDGKRLGWDPHHTDADLRPSIRAGLALDPSRASVRFASYFDDAAVASDAGAKVAHDVWMLAAGRVVSHDGTELSSGDGDILSRDPGWFSIASVESRPGGARRASARHPCRGEACREKACCEETCCQTRCEATRYEESRREDEVTSILENARSRLASEVSASPSRSERPSKLEGARPDIHFRHHGRRARDGDGDTPRARDDERGSYRREGAPGDHRGRAARHRAAIVQAA